MGMFIGSYKEYHKYIGPRIRNAVNLIARNERMNRKGECEECKKQRELQSAHRHGMERKKIIENVLEKYIEMKTTGIDLELIEKEILEMHYPIESTFRFLCMECHKKYDSKQSLHEDNDITLTIEEEDEITKEYSEIGKDEVTKVINRIPLWLKNGNQINSTILITYLRIRENNDNILIDDLKKATKLGDKFESNFDQMRYISKNNHAKVFQVQDGKIELWNKVREYIIDRYNDLTIPLT